MNYACPKKSFCEAACLGREVLVVKNYQIQPAKTTQEGRIYMVLNEALEDNNPIFQKASNLASLFCTGHRPVLRTTPCRFLVCSCSCFITAPIVKIQQAQI